MSASIFLALGIHNHQPVGNFPAVFEETWEKAYRPFLEVLEKHPRIKLTLHYTGPLWDYFLEHKPEWAPRLRRLVEAGTVELLTGACYEPILGVIPDQDKRGQIQRLTRIISAHTGTAPRGMWLAERVWEPHLPHVLAEAGIEYTILDELHFRAAGLDSSALFGYYLTEEQGRILAVFPISYRLRHLIPFAPVEETIEYLRQHADEVGSRLVVMADDGEKFGTWPGTYQTCYQEGWLDSFFTALEENSDWIKPVLFSEYLDLYPPSGKIYLPDASYLEMMQWALPTAAGKILAAEIEQQKAQDRWDSIEPFLRGISWRNFLVKYPESDRMHKKALWVSRKVDKMFGPTRANAQEALWKGQCNCGYWHGIFGGLYLNHIRSAIYENLLEAEVMAATEEHAGRPFIQVQAMDYDLDGHAEILVSSDNLNLYFKPALGGALFELDYLPRRLNLLNTLTRREETYHQAIRELAANQDRESGRDLGEQVPGRPKESGLEKRLAYDWYQRLGMIDHFIAAEDTLETFSACAHDEKGDFVNQPYDYRLHEEHDQATIAMVRNGGIWIDNSFRPLKVEKEINLRSGQDLFTISHRITNPTDQPMKLRFAVEWNLNLPGGVSPLCGIMSANRKEIQHALDARLEKTDITRLAVRDGWRGCEFQLEFSEKADSWIFPIETVSQSEGGYERTYQSTVILPIWSLELEPGAAWSVRTTFMARSIPAARTTEAQPDQEQPEAEAIPAPDREEETAYVAWPPRKVMVKISDEISLSEPSAPPPPAPEEALITSPPMEEIPELARMVPDDFISPLQPPAGVVSEPPSLMAEVPALMDEVPSIMAEVPALMDEVPSVMAEVPALMDEVPSIMAEVPALMDEVPSIMAEVPSLMDEVPSIMAEVPALMDEVPSIVAEEPTLMDEATSIMTETPALMAEMPSSMAAESAIESPIEEAVEEPAAEVAAQAAPIEAELEEMIVEKSPETVSGTVESAVEETTIEEPVEEPLVDEFALGEGPAPIPLGPYTLDQRVNAGIIVPDAPFLPPFNIQPASEIYAAQAPEQQPYALGPAVATRQQYLMILSPTSPPAAAEVEVEVVSEPIAEPKAESIAEPISELITEPITEPMVEPIAEPITESISLRVAEPVAPPVVESTPIHVTKTSPTKEDTPVVEVIKPEMVTAAQGLKLMPPADTTKADISFLGRWSRIITEETRTTPPAGPSRALLELKSLLELEKQHELARPPKPVAEAKAAPAPAAPEPEPPTAIEPEPVAEAVPVVEAVVAETEPEPVVEEPATVQELVEELPEVEPEPEPVAAVEPEPEPVAAIEPEPVAEVVPVVEAVVAETIIEEPAIIREMAEKPPEVVPEHEPVAAVEPEPVAAVEPEQVAAVEPEPVAAVEPELVAAVEPEPPAQAVPVVEAIPAPAPKGKPISLGSIKAKEAEPQPGKSKGKGFFGKLFGG